MNIAYESLNFICMAGWSRGYLDFGCRADWIDLVDMG